jgi:hypothetical protein
MMGGAELNPSTGKKQWRVVGSKGEDDNFPPSGLDVQTLIQFPVDPRYSNTAGWGLLNITYEHVGDDAKLLTHLRSWVSQRINPQYKAQHEKPTLQELYHRVKHLVSGTFKKAVRPNRQMPSSFSQRATFSRVPRQQPPPQPQPQCARRNEGRSQ